MQIWIENMPNRVSWSSEAILALNWNIQTICRDNSLAFEVLSIGEYEGKGLTAEVFGLPVDLSESQMKGVAKTIARFLQYHDDLCLENGLEVVVTRNGIEERMSWECFKELV